MSAIVLTTLNAKYPHSSLGLRYLYANMKELQDRTRLLEFTINEQPLDILDRILESEPGIVGFGVYIWNIAQTAKVVAALKAVRPQTVVVLGGPEVSYENEELEIVQIADYVISGEADLAFPQLCRQIEDGENFHSSGSMEELSSKHGITRIIKAAVPQLDRITLPYDFYSDEDLANRVIYVEASRGCPYLCEFCLSSLEIPVRQFDVDSFLKAIDLLMKRGATQLKFVDRTFNLNLKTGLAILEFLLDRYRPGMFFHFEMIPDRFPEQLREIIERFPAGSLQFEVGIQTFNPKVAESISRRQDYEKTEKNLRYFREKTGVHIHADLIVGLPGETLESFADGFDRMVAMHPQEIQVGILKKLRGTPISRHDDEWKMIYSPSAPYEILENKLVSASDMARMRRFARFWDLTANSGNFLETLPLIWNGGSPFVMFLKFSDWMYERVGRSYGVPLRKLMEYVFDFLVLENDLSASEISPSLARDYSRLGRRDTLPFLSQVGSDKNAAPPRNLIGKSRQSRHATQ